MDSDEYSDAEDLDNLGNRSGYIQAPSLGPHAASIIGDVFHVENKLGRELKAKHSLSIRFAAAFSDTLLVPDKGDKRRVEAVLAKKNLTWDQIRNSSPAWLWRRVRRYIPEKSLLYKLLKEMFDCWGPIVCSVSKIPLFDDDAWKKAKSMMGG